MDVASLCPLPVGVVWWRSPRRALTVVVKMTLAIEDDELSIAEVQEPLCLDEPSAVDAPDELFYASDFVPRKARCDVLLVGHARASRPSPLIAARFAVGDLDRRFFALAAEPSQAIPLSATYLRARETSGSQVVSVGPATAWSLERSRLAGGAVLGAHGGPIAPLDADFDFSYFNAAPRAQQLNELGAGAVVALEGLLSDGAPCVVQIPSERPRIYAVARSARPAAARALTEIPLRCDTLWIDADRAILTLVWRGSIEITRDEDEPAELVATLPRCGLSERLPDVEKRLDGAPRVRAVEPSDLAGAPPSISDEYTRRDGINDRNDDDDYEDPPTLGGLSVQPRVQERAPAEPVPAEPVEDDEKPQRAMGALGSFRLGSTLADESNEEKTGIHIALPQKRPPSDQGHAAVARDAAPPDAEEILDFEEVEPEEEDVAELTEDAVMAVEPEPRRARPERPDIRDLISNTSGLKGETTQTGIAIPIARSVALPFDRAPVSPPASEDRPALPFTQKKRTTLISPPSSPQPEPSSALPFIRPQGARPEPPPHSEVPSALPFTIPRKEMFADSEVTPPAGISAALPFVQPSFVRADPPPSIPLSPPPEVPSALPFGMPAAPPISPPAWSPVWSPAPMLEPLAPAPPVTAPAPLVTAPAPPVTAPAPPATATEPPPPDAPPLLALEIYAAIQMDLWDESAPFEDVLARHGVDEIAWRDNERRRAEVLAEEARQGRSELALALADALDAVRAKRALPPEGEGGLLTLDKYVALRAEIDAAPDALPILEKRSLTEPQWQSIHRAWRKRSRADAALAQELRAKLAEARRALAARDAAARDAALSPKRRAKKRASPAKGAT
jgi:hypothetical protein